MEKCGKCPWVENKTGADRHNRTGGYKHTVEQFANYWMNFIDWRCCEPLWDGLKMWTRIERNRCAAVMSFCTYQRITQRVDSSVRSRCVEFVEHVSLFWLSIYLLGVHVSVCAVCVYCVCIGCAEQVQRRQHHRELTVLLGFKFFLWFLDG